MTCVAQPPVGAGLCPLVGGTFNTTRSARGCLFLVDGQSLGTFAFDPSATSNILRRGSLIVYAAPDTSTNEKADYAAHFDKFSINVTGR